MTLNEVVMYHRTALVIRKYQGSRFLRALHVQKLMPAPVRVESPRAQGQEHAPGDRA